MSSWETFIAWVEAPEAYNWLTLLGVAVGGMTAIFTGYTAGTQWVDRRRKVTAEWSHVFNDNHIVISCKIQNGTKGTIIGDRAVVKGDLSHIKEGSQREKHKSWASNEAPASIEIAPGGTGKLVFDVFPDPVRLRKQATRYSSKIGFSLSKFLWQRLHWQLPLGASVSMLIRLRRRSSPMRPIRITHRIRIYEPMAMKIADNVDEAAHTK
ncbi:MAG: hypothetical protein KBT76_15445 [Sulfitobacter litoralis]|nr:hypothetical protein [Sulfitobacter litoralis]